MLGEFGEYDERERLDRDVIGRAIRNILEREARRQREIEAVGVGAMPRQGMPRRGTVASPPRAQRSEIARYIIRRAQEMGFSPQEIGILLTIANIESSFNPHTTGDGGKSYGLFQINVARMPKYGLKPQNPEDVRKLYDWRYNTELALRDFAQLRDILRRTRPEWLREPDKHFPDISWAYFAYWNFPARLKQVLSGGAEWVRQNKGAGIYKLVSPQVMQQKVKEAIGILQQNAPIVAQQARVQMASKLLPLIAREATEWQARLPTLTHRVEAPSDAVQNLLTNLAPAYMAWRNIDDLRKAVQKALGERVYRQIPKETAQALAKVPSDTSGFVRAFTRAALGKLYDVLDEREKQQIVTKLSSALEKWSKRPVPPLSREHEKEVEQFRQQFIRDLFPVVRDIAGMVVGRDVTPRWKYVLTSAGHVLWDMVTDFIGYGGMIADTLSNVVVAADRSTYERWRRASEETARNIQRRLPTRAEREAFADLYNKLLSDRPALQAANLFKALGHGAGRLIKAVASFGGYISERVVGLLKGQYPQYSKAIDLFFSRTGIAGTLEGIAAKLARDPEFRRAHEEDAAFTLLFFAPQEVTRQRKPTETGWYLYAFNMLSHYAEEYLNTHPYIKQDKALRFVKHKSIEQVPMLGFMVGPQLAEALVGGVIKGVAGSALRALAKSTADAGATLNVAARAALYAQAARTATRLVVSPHSVLIRGVEPVVQSGIAKALLRTGRLQRWGEMIAGLKVEQGLLPPAAKQAFASEWAAAHAARHAFLISRGLSWLGEGTASGAIFFAPHRGNERDIIAGMLAGIAVHSTMGLMHLGSHIVGEGFRGKGWREIWKEVSRRTFQSPELVGAILRNTFREVYRLPRREAQRLANRLVEMYHLERLYDAAEVAGRGEIPRTAVDIVARAYARTAAALDERVDPQELATRIADQLWHSENRVEDFKSLISLTNALTKVRFVGEYYQAAGLSDAWTALKQGIDDTVREWGEALRISTSPHAPTLMLRLADIVWATLPRALMKSDEVREERRGEVVVEPEVKGEYTVGRVLTGVLPPALVRVVKLAVEAAKRVSPRAYDFFVGEVAEKLNKIENEIRSGRRRERVEEGKVELTATEEASRFMISKLVDAYMDYVTDGKNAEEGIRNLLASVRERFKRFVATTTGREGEELENEVSELMRIIEDEALREGQKWEEEWRREKEIREMMREAERTPTRAEREPRGEVEDWEELLWEDLPAEEAERVEEAIAEGEAGEEAEGEIGLEELFEEAPARRRRRRVAEAREEEEREEEVSAEEFDLADLFDEVARGKTPSVSAIYEAMVEGIKELKARGKIPLPARQSPEEIAQKILEFYAINNNLRVVYDNPQEVKEAIEGMSVASPETSLEEVFGGAPQEKPPQVVVFETFVRPDEAAEAARRAQSAIDMMREKGLHVYAYKLIYPWTDEYGQNATSYVVLGTLLDWDADVDEQGRFRGGTPGDIIMRALVAGEEPFFNYPLEAIRELRAQMTGTGRERLEDIRPALRRGKERGSTLLLGLPRQAAISAAYPFARVISLLRGEEQSLVDPRATMALYMFNSSPRWSIKVTATTGKGAAREYYLMPFFILDVDPAAPAGGLVTASLPITHERILQTLRSRADRERAFIGGWEEFVRVVQETAGTTDPAHLSAERPKGRERPQQYIAITIKLSPDELAGLMETYLRHSFEGRITEAFDTFLLQGRGLGERIQAAIAEKWNSVTEGKVTTATSVEMMPSAGKALMMENPQADVLAKRLSNVASGFCYVSAPIGAVLEQAGIDVSELARAFEGMQIGNINMGQLIQKWFQSRILVTPYLQGASDDVVALTRPSLMSRFVPSWPEVLYHAIDASSLMHEFLHTLFNLVLEQTFPAVEVGKEQIENVLGAVTALKEILAEATHAWWARTLRESPATLPSKTINIPHVVQPVRRQLASERVMLHKETTLEQLTITGLEALWQAALQAAPEIREQLGGRADSILADLRRLGAGRVSKEQVVDALLEIWRLLPQLPQEVRSREALRSLEDALERALDTYRNWVIERVTRERLKEKKIVGKERVVATEAPPEQIEGEEVPPDVIAEREAELGEEVLPEKAELPEEAELPAEEAPVEAAAEVEEEVEGEELDVQRLRRWQSIKERIGEEKILILGAVPLIERVVEEGEVKERVTGIVPMVVLMPNGAALLDAREGCRRLGGVLKQLENLPQRVENLTIEVGRRPQEGEKDLVSVVHAVNKTINRLRAALQAPEKADRTLLGTAYVLRRRYAGGAAIIRFGRLFRPTEKGRAIDEYIEFVAQRLDEVRLLAERAKNEGRMEESRMYELTANLMERNLERLYALQENSADVMNELGAVGRRAERLIGALESLLKGHPLLRLVEELERVREEGLEITDEDLERVKETLSVYGIELPEEVYRGTGIVEVRADAWHELEDALSERGVKLPSGIYRRIGERVEVTDEGWQRIERLLSEHGIEMPSEAYRRVWTEETALRILHLLSDRVVVREGDSIVEDLTNLYMRAGEILTAFDAFVRGRGSINELVEIPRERARFTTWGTYLSLPNLRSLGLVAATRHVIGEALRALPPEEKARLGIALGKIAALVKSGVLGRVASMDPSDPLTHGVLWVDQLALALMNDPFASPSLAGAFAAAKEAEGMWERESEIVRAIIGTPDMTKRLREMFPAGEAGDIGRYAVAAFCILDPDIANRLSTILGRAANNLEALLATLRTIPVPEGEEEVAALRDTLAQAVERQLNALREINGIVTPALSSEGQIDEKINRFATLVLKIPTAFDMIEIALRSTALREGVRRLGVRGGEELLAEAAGLLADASRILPSPDNVFGSALIHPKIYVEGRRGESIVRDVEEFEASKLTYVPLSYLVDEGIPSILASVANLTGSIQHAAPFVEAAILLLRAFSLPQTAEALGSLSSWFREAALREKIRQEYLSRGVVPTERDIERAVEEAREKEGVVPPSAVARAQEAVRALYPSTALPPTYRAAAAREEFYNTYAKRLASVLDTYNEVVRTLLTSPQGRLVLERVWDASNEVAKLAFLEPALGIRPAAPEVAATIVRSERTRKKLVFPLIDWEVLEALVSFAERAKRAGGMAQVAREVGDWLSTVRNVKEVASEVLGAEGRETTKRLLGGILAAWAALPPTTIAGSRMLTEFLSMPWLRAPARSRPAGVFPPDFGALGRILMRISQGDVRAYSELVSGRTIDPALITQVFLPFSFYSLSSLVPYAVVLPSRLAWDEIVRDFARLAGDAVSLAWMGSLPLFPSKELMLSPDPSGLNARQVMRSVEMGVNMALAFMEASLDRFLDKHGIADEAMRNAFKQLFAHDIRLMIQKGTLPIDPLAVVMATRERLRMGRIEEELFPREFSVNWDAFLGEARDVVAAASGLSAEEVAALIKRKKTTVRGLRELEVSFLNQRMQPARAAEALSGIARRISVREEGVSHVEVERALHAAYYFYLLRSTIGMLRGQIERGAIGDVRRLREVFEDVTRRVGKADFIANMLFDRGSDFDSRVKALVSRGVDERVAELVAERPYLLARVPEHLLDTAINTYRELGLLLNFPPAMDVLLSCVAKRLRGIQLPEPEGVIQTDVVGRAGESKEEMERRALRAEIPEALQEEISRAVAEGVVEGVEILEAVGNGMVRNPVIERLRREWLEALRSGDRDRALEKAAEFREAVENVCRRATFAVQEDPATIRSLRSLIRYFLVRDEEGKAWLPGAIAMGAVAGLVIGAHWFPPLAFALKSMLSTIFAWNFAKIALPVIAVSGAYELYRWLGRHGWFWGKMMQAAEGAATQMENARRQAYNEILAAARGIATGAMGQAGAQEAIVWERVVEDVAGLLEDDLTARTVTSFTSGMDVELTLGGWRVTPKQPAGRRRVSPGRARLELAHDILGQLGALGDLLRGATNVTILGTQTTLVNALTAARRLAGIVMGRIVTPELVIQLTGNPDMYTQLLHAQARLFTLKHLVDRIRAEEQNPAHNGDANSIISAVENSSVGTAVVLRGKRGRGRAAQVAELRTDHIQVNGRPLSQLTWREAWQELMPTEMQATMGASWDALKNAYIGGGMNAVRDIVGKIKNTAIGRWRELIRDQMMRCVANLRGYDANVFTTVGQISRSISDLLYVINRPHTAAALASNPQFLPLVAHKLLEVQYLLGRLQIPSDPNDPLNVLKSAVDQMVEAVKDADKNVYQQAAELAQITSSMLERGSEQVARLMNAGSFARAIDAAHRFARQLWNAITFTMGRRLAPLTELERHLAPAIDVFGRLPVVMEDAVVRAARERMDVNRLSAVAQTMHRGMTTHTAYLRLREMADKGVRPEGLLLLLRRSFETEARKIAQSQRVNPEQAMKEINTLIYSIYRLTPDMAEFRNMSVTNAVESIISQNAPTVEAYLRSLPQPQRDAFIHRAIIAALTSRYMITSAASGLSLETILLMQPEVLHLIEPAYYPQYTMGMELGALEQFIRLSLEGPGQRVLGRPSFAMERTGRAMPEAEQFFDRIGQVYRALTIKKAIVGLEPQIQALLWLLPAAVRPLFQAELSLQTGISQGGPTNLVASIIDETASGLNNAARLLGIQAERFRLMSGLAAGNPILRTLARITSWGQLNALAWNIFSILRQTLAVPTAVALTSLNLNNSPVTNTIIFMGTWGRLIGNLIPFLRQPLNAFERMVLREMPAVIARENQNLTWLITQSHEALERFAERYPEAMEALFSPSATRAQIADAMNKLTSFMFFDESATGRLTQASLAALGFMDALIVRTSAIAAAKCYLAERYKQTGTITEADIKAAVAFGHHVAVESQATPSRVWQPAIMQHPLMQGFVGMLFRQFVVFTFAEAAVMARMARHLYGGLYEAIVGSFRGGKTREALGKAAGAIAAMSAMLLAQHCMNAAFLALAGRPLQELPVGYPPRYSKRKEDILSDYLVGLGVELPLSSMPFTMYRIANLAVGALTGGVRRDIALVESLNVPPFLRNITGALYDLGILIRAQQFGRVLEEMYGKGSGVTQHKLALFNGLEHVSGAGTTARRKAFLYEFLAYAWPFLAHGITEAAKAVSPAAGLTVTAAATLFPGGVIAKGARGVVSSQVAPVPSEALGVHPVVARILAAITGAPFRETIRPPVALPPRVAEEVGGAVAAKITTPGETKTRMAEAFMREFGDMPYTHLVGVIHELIRSSNDPKTAGAALMFANVYDWYNLAASEEGAAGNFGRQLVALKNLAKDDLSKEKVANYLLCNADFALALCVMGGPEALGWAVAAETEKPEEALRSTLDKLSEKDATIYGVIARMVERTRNRNLWLAARKTYDDVKIRLSVQQRVRRRSRLMRGE